MSVTMAPSEQETKGWHTMTKIFEKLKVFHVPVSLQSFPKQWHDQSPTLALFSYVQNTASAGHKPQSYSLQVSGRKWNIVINLNWIFDSHGSGAGPQTGIMGTAADGFFKPGLKWWLQNQTWHQKSHNSYVFNYRIASRGPALNIL